MFAEGKRKEGRERERQEKGRETYRKGKERREKGKERTRKRRRSSRGPRIRSLHSPWVQKGVLHRRAWVSYEQEKLPPPACPETNWYNLFTLTLT